MTTTVETKQWSYVDKSGWQRGPWDDEPDKMQWQDELTGLACLIVRGPGGALCGYVGVTGSHPWHDVGYNECALPVKCEDSWCGHQPDLDVHGGLTFASRCSPHEDNPERGVCHVIEGDDDTWWFGFDCGHSGDQSPGHAAHEALRGGGALFGMFSDGTYKDVGYVQRYVTRMAGQLAAVNGGGK